jgi:hypothetical protein
MSDTSMEYLAPNPTTPETRLYKDESLSETIPEVVIKCGCNKGTFSMGILPTGSVGFVMEDSEGNPRGTLLTYESALAFLQAALTLLEEGKNAHA